MCFLGRSRGRRARATLAANAAARCISIGKEVWKDVFKRPRSSQKHPPRFRHRANPPARKPHRQAIRLHCPQGRRRFCSYWRKRGRKTRTNATGNASSDQFRPPARFGRTFLRSPNIFRKTQNDEAPLPFHPFFKMLTLLKNVFANDNWLISFIFSGREVFKRTKIGSSYCWPASPFPATSSQSPTLKSARDTPQPANRTTHKAVGGRPDG